MAILEASTTDELCIYGKGEGFKVIAVFKCVMPERGDVLSSAKVLHVRASRKGAFIDTRDVAAENCGADEIRRAGKASQGSDGQVVVRAES